MSTYSNSIWHCLLPTIGVFVILLNEFEMFRLTVDFYYFEEWIKRRMRHYKLNAAARGVMRKSYSEKLCNITMKTLLKDSPFWRVADIWRTTNWKVPRKFDHFVGLVFEGLRNLSNFYDMIFYVVLWATKIKKLPLKIQWCFPW